MINSLNNCEMVPWFGFRYLPLEGGDFLLWLVSLLLIIVWFLYPDGFLIVVRWLHRPKRH